MKIYKTHALRKHSHWDFPLWFLLLLWIQLLSYWKYQAGVFGGVFVFAVAHLGRGTVFLAFTGGSFSRPAGPQPAIRAFM
jgi:hypothetical protein